MPDQPQPMPARIEPGWGLPWIDTDAIPFVHTITHPTYGSHVVALDMSQRDVLIEAGWTLTPAAPFPNLPHTPKEPPPPPPDPWKEPRP